MSELFSGHSPETLDLLLRRRSSSAKAMGEPGPSPEQARLILQAGIRVPDHGKLNPWRFVLFEGEARAQFGEVLARELAASKSNVSDALLRFERGRFLRAPLVIAIISAPVADKPIPEWEQRLSAGAVCQTMLIAATALGFGAQWITEWCAYDAGVTKALGLSGDERVAGFLYVGTRREPLSERPRPDLDALAQHWRAASSG
jgi:nitroreductase